MRPSFTFMAINKKGMLTINIPSKLYEEIDVASTSGDIHVADLETIRIGMEVTAGDITSTSLISDTLEIEST